METIVLTGSSNHSHIIIAIIDGNAQVTAPQYTPAVHPLAGT